VSDLWVYCVVAWWLDCVPKLLGDLVKREQKLSAVDKRVSNVFCIDTSAFAMAKAY